MKLIDAEELKTNLIDSCTWYIIDEEHDNEPYYTVSDVEEEIDRQKGIDPLKEVLDGMEELKKSPWFYQGTIATRYFKEAFVVIRDVVIKGVMKKYEID